MTRRFLALALLLSFTMGCEPPPPIDVAVPVEPAITIAYPDLNGDEFALVCRPNPLYDCTDPGAVAPYAEVLEMLIVVDIDNLQLQDPYVPDVDNVDGQGHWHATLGALPAYQPSFERSTTLEAPLEEVTLGTTRLTVSLQDNSHDDVTGANVADSVEFQLVNAEQDCAALAEDYCPPP